MSWIILFLAGLFEVCWAVGLKYTDGFTLFPFRFTAQFSALFSTLFRHHWLRTFRFVVCLQFLRMMLPSPWWR